MARNGNEQAYHSNPLFNKDLGQHILKNPLVAQTMIEKAGITLQDIVFEVGPGTGNLSCKILERAKKLIAIEKDPRLAAELIKRFQENPKLNEKLQLIVGDVMNMDFPKFDLFISNTPYQISSPLIFKLLSSKTCPFRQAIMMFQREFAMRLIAKPGDELWCRLSVNAQLYSHITHIMKISRNSFRPPPKVDSSVVRIEPFHPRPNIDFEEWDGMIRILFMRRNKTVLANFKTQSVINLMLKNYQSLMNIASNKERIVEIIQQSGYSDHRASKMSIDDFLKLLLAFNREGFHFR